MAESKTASTTSGTFRYLIGGEAYGTPHEPGDEVPEDVRPSKLKEWLDAGIVEKVDKRRK